MGTLKMRLRKIEVWPKQSVHATLESSISKNEFNNKTPFLIKNLIYYFVSWAFLGGLGVGAHLTGLFDLELCLRLRFACPRFSFRQRYYFIGKFVPERERTL